ncbi:SDR family oxidoreductase [Microbulbifer spongiae]|uniref:SDR family oxidoreductase n=1 Tax=Microbulbifer spongiae TaxID=2944933 RepID=A0ABY9E8Z3_9GAMM|nr:SDR family oxidoreductase [Microbulbifer sp. MI-G]WKD48421.1 SDR family oxidoreductase [Microbulbifer sp. MI-G]
MSNNLFDLTGKIALVTGASRGIGAAIAKLLAQQGAHVLVSSRKIEGCRAMADHIVRAGGRADPVPCHIGNLEEIQHVFAGVRERFGRLDILVNNAATNPYFGHILDTDPSAVDKTIEVNIRGYFFMSVEAGRLMRQHGGGAIVNIASINALQPGVGQGIYSITKAAVVNMTKAFAKECAQFNIRVNALLPGLTKTKFAGALFSHEEVYKAAIDHIPMHRHAEPEEMAGTVLYLVSEASSYTTGECVVVDGGLTSCGGI